MINQITHPLLQERGIEALREIVADVESQIYKGLLWDTHEVEVTLKTSGRVRSKASPPFATH